MSIGYTMKILRPNDRKVVAEFDANIIKTILDADDKLIPTSGSEFNISTLWDVSKGCKQKISALKTEIDKMENGIYRCRTVDVKHEIEEDIQCKKELLKDYEYASDAVMQLIGAVHCLTEDLVMRDAKGDKGEKYPADDGSGDLEDEGTGTGEYQLAYNYWKWPNEHADGDYTRWNYLWDHVAILKVTYS